MSDEKSAESENPSADDLIKANKPDDIKLSEEDLKQVSGGGKLQAHDISVVRSVQKASTSL
jgi:bacteriocin-like protein